MIKEAKNVDFYTTGRQLSDQDFALISEWIRKDKQKQTRKNNKKVVNQKHPAQRGTAKKELKYKV